MVDKLRSMQGLFHRNAPHILPNVSIYIPPDVFRRNPPTVRIPSAIGANGRAFNLKGWQERVATEADILKWAEDDRLGFGIRCAYVRAIDIDIDDHELAMHVYDTATKVGKDLQRANKYTAQPFAIRRRTNSYRCTLLCKATHYEALPFSKVVVNLPGTLGKIEFLGNSQYTALYGDRFDEEGKLVSYYYFQRFGTDYDKDYEDDDALYPVLDQLPILSNEDLLFVAGKIQEELEAYLDEAIGVSEDYSSTVYPRGFGVDEITELGKLQLAEIKSQIIKEGSLADARWFVQCPWEHEHTTTGGDRDAMFIPDRIKDDVNFSATYKCFHGHCEHRTAEDYAEKFDLPILRKKETSVEAAAIAVKPEQLVDCITVDTLTSCFSFLSHSHAVEIIKMFKSPLKSDYVVTKIANNEYRPLAHRRHTMNEIAAITNKGKKTVTKIGKKTRVTTTMIINAMRDLNHFGYDVSYDRFLNAVKIRKYDSTSDWEIFKDKHISVLKMALNKLKFPDPSTTALREAVTLVAETNSTDCAIDWLDSQDWDGHSRFEEFIVNGLGLHPTDYLADLTAYIWTALAGRIIEPGCKADMIPIFVGFQGAKKSTLIETLAPFIEWYTTAALDVHDADIARKTRGKCVLELPELSGLKTKSNEAIKAWATIRIDNWVPKFKEHAYDAPRRWIAFGTGNDKRLFTDPTGNRRWLPIDMTGSKGLNTEWIKQNRNQLWAEGKVKFNESGIAWQDVTESAGAHREMFRQKDAWYGPIRQFHDTYGRIPTVQEAFTVCLNLSIGHVSPYQTQRVETVLATLEAELAGMDKEGIVQRSYVDYSPPALTFDDWEM